MTSENFLMCAILALIELKTVVQSCIVLPTSNHVLIFMSELKQQLIQDTNILSHVPQIQKILDMKLTRTFTMTVKTNFKLQSSDTMLLAATSVKIFYVMFLIFPTNSLTELSNLLEQLPFLQNPIKNNQKIRNKIKNQIKANFKQLLLIRILMDFGSIAHDPIKKDYYQKFPKRNFHCANCNRMKCT